MGGLRCWLEAAKGWAAGDWARRLDLLESGGEDAEDGAGDVALERAQRLAGVLAFADPASEIRAGGCVDPCLGDRDDVERLVQAPVPRPVEAVPVVLAAGGQQWSDAAVGSEVRFAGEPVDAFDLGEDAGGAQHAAAGEREQAGAAATDEATELALELFDAAVELADASDQLAADQDLGVLRLARELSGELVEIGGQRQAAKWWLQLGVDLVQVRAQACADGACIRRAGSRGGRSAA
jgi:hypothetical protein